MKVKNYIIISTPAKEGKDGQPGWMLSLASGLLRRIIPAANPDFDQLYERVVTWHVELDGDGAPQREVGLDASGRVLAIAPWRENVGVMVDSDATFDPAKHDHISREQFEREWESFRG